MIKLCQMSVCNKEIANKITSKAEGSRSTERNDGKVEVSFPFIDNYVKKEEGVVEKVVYMLENGVFALITEDKQVITDVSFVESKDVLKKIVFKH